MASASLMVESEPSKHVSTNRLAKVGSLAAMTVIVVNVLVLEFALAVVDVPAAFEPLPLGWGPVVVSSAIGAVGATVVYGAVARYATRPNRTFTLVAAAVLVLSYGNFFTPVLAGAPATVYAILGLMHVTAAVTIVAILRRTPTHQDGVARVPR